MTDNCEDKVGDLATTRDQMRATPCPIRCWRVGSPVQTKVGEKCVECGRVEPAPADITAAPAMKESFPRTWFLFADERSA